MQKSIGQLYSEYKAAKAARERAFARQPRIKTWEEFVDLWDRQGKAEISLKVAESNLRLRWLDTFGSPF